MILTKERILRLCLVELLALLLAGCAPWPTSDSVGQCRTNLDSCLLRARALAEGAPRLVTYAETARWCKEDGR